jgi:predicted Zn finger-like uncharacterized protein
MVEPSARDDFICPGCQALYRIVRMKSESGAAYMPVPCKVCRQPMAATEGDDVLKYFLVRKRPRG